MCCICLKENVVFNAAIKSSEEAPSSVLSPDLRQKWSETAVLVAKSCDYLMRNCRIFYWMKITILFSRNEHTFASWNTL
jgi:hypothetical protein